MEYAMAIRQMTQQAVVDHVAALELQKDNEVALYFEQVLPNLTRRFFEELMAAPGRHLSFDVNINILGLKAGSITVWWRHPPLAGIGPGFFSVTSKDILHGLNGNIDTRVQDKVRTFLRDRGWQCWWTEEAFCFQDKQDFEIVEKGMRLFACYRNEGAGDLLLSDS